MGEAERAGRSAQHDSLGARRSHTPRSPRPARRRQSQRATARRAVPNQPPGRVQAPRVAPSAPGSSRARARPSGVPAVCAPSRWDRSTNGCSTTGGSGTPASTGSPTTCDRSSKGNQHATQEEATDVYSQMPPEGVVSAASDETGILIVRVFDAPRARVQGLDRARAVRDVVRRARIVDPAREHLHGCPARRGVERDHDRSGSRRRSRSSANSERSWSQSWSR